MAKYAKIKLYVINNIMTGWNSLGVFISLIFEMDYKPSIGSVQLLSCVLLFVTPRIAARFTVGRTWKQPRRPSTDEYIRKLWYIYTIEYYPAINRNAFESVLKRWMNLEFITE